MEHSGVTAAAGNVSVFSHSVINSAEFPTLLFTGPGTGLFKGLVFLQRSYSVERISSAAADA